MSRILVGAFSVVIGLALMVSSAGAQSARVDGEERGDRARIGSVERFATLPERISPTGIAEGHPEGLCADTEGHIYADSFEQPLTNGTYVQNYIYTFGRDGTLIAATPTASGVVPLGCIVSGNKFYMNDVYNGDEIVYTLPLTDTSVPETKFHICGGFVGNPGPVCGLNANYPGPDGRIYMSDNGAGLFGDFTGRIWVLDPNTGSSGIFIDPPEIAVRQLPAADYVPVGTVLPYSANGIAFSRDGSALYIANMSTDTIYKQKVKQCWDSINGCEPDGPIAVFSDDSRIQGPDNMDFDDHGHLFIASGQNQHVIELDSSGKVIGVFGSFRGFTDEGAPKGLLQPSGIIFSKGRIYVGNESSESLLPTADKIDWAKLKLFTISSIDPGDNCDR